MTAIRADEMTAEQWVDWFLTQDRARRLLIAEHAIQKSADTARGWACQATDHGQRLEQAATSRQQLLDAMQDIANAATEMGEAAQPAVLGVLDRISRVFGPDFHFDYSESQKKS